MISVTPVRREDADVFLNLIDALADYEKLARPDEEARQRLIYDSCMTDPPRFSSFLAREAESGRAVGYAIFFETYSSFLARPTLYIEDLFVIPEARGLGAGDALFRYLVGEAERRGCGRMEWVCLDWNQLAIGFYEKRGAQHLHDWRYYRLNADQFASFIEDAERIKPGG